MKEGGEKVTCEHKGFIATNLLHVLEIGGKATVAAEDLLINDCSDWEAVEAVCKGLPELDVEAALACKINEGERERCNKISVTTRSARTEDIIV